MKIYIKPWGTPRCKWSFFTFYILPVLRVDSIKITDAEKNGYELNYNRHVFIVIGWLFWTYEVNVKI